MKSFYILSISIYSIPLHTDLYIYIIKLHVVLRTFYKILRLFQFKINWTEIFMIFFLNRLFCAVSEALLN